MSDAIIWLLLAMAILATQATEPPVAATAGEGAKPEGRADTRAIRPAGTVFGAGPGSGTVARAVLGAAAATMVLIGLLTLAGAQGTSSAPHGRNHDIVSGALQLAAGLATLALFYGGTARVPGLRHLREKAPISWLAILLYMESLASNLTPSSGETTVTSTVQASSPTSAESLMVGALPFLVIGVASAGPGVRRTLRETAERLGFWPLRLPWWAVGLAVGIALVPVGDWVAGLLSSLTSANCLAQQVQVEHAIAGTGRTVLEQIGVAVAAGVCEETLFRGALQPRFGILLSSALWASYHLQYTCNGIPSSSNLYILLLGLVFGVLRKWGGLWPAIVAHSVYDGTILLGLL